MEVPNVGDEHEDFEDDAVRYIVLEKERGGEGGEFPDFVIRN